MVSVSVPGLPDENRWVWLSLHRDLRADGVWLVVDDFSGTALGANLGPWGTYNNGSAGGTAYAGPLAPSVTGPDRSMAWDFDLGTGGYRYFGVEWRTGGWPGLAHADRIRYRARSRADGNGLVRWAPPRDATGLILVGVEGRRDARALILAPSFLPGPARRPLFGRRGGGTYILILMSRGKAHR